MKNARITRLFYFVLLISLFLLSGKMKTPSYAGDFSVTCQPGQPCNVGSLTTSTPITYSSGGTQVNGSITIPSCTIYASTGGSGSTCSLASPCTAQQALLNAVAGSVVCLNNGTYNYVSGSATLTIPNVGTSAQPLWVRPTNPVTVITSVAGTYNTPPVKIGASGGTSELGIYNGPTNNSGNTVIYGFEVDGTAGTTPKQGIYFGSTSALIPIAHITIMNNLVHNWGSSGIACNDADYCQLIGNVVHDVASTDTACASGIGYYESINADQAPGWHNLVEGNVVYNVLTPGGTCIDGNGIFVEDDGDHSQVSPSIPYTGNTLVENNVGYNNAGACIKTFNTNHATEMVRNNTCYQNYITASPSGPPPKGGTGEIIGQNASGIIYSNNIVQPNASGNSGNNVGYGNFTSTGSSNVWVDNMCYSPSSQACWFSTASTTPDVNPANFNFFFVNPLWTTPGSAIFTLQAGSPAIRTSRSQYGQPQIDILGNLRVDAQDDLGAYLSSVQGLLEYFPFTTDPTQEPADMTPWTLLPVRGPFQAYDGLYSQGGMREYSSVVQYPIGTPSAPNIVSGFTSGTTDYYWCVAEDINGFDTLVSAGTGTTGTTGTMSCGPQQGAIKYYLLRTASSSAPSGTGSFLVPNTTTTTGTALISSYSPVNLIDAAGTLGSFTVQTTDYTGGYNLESSTPWIVGQAGQLNLSENGDTFGTATLTIENRSGQDGFLFQTGNASAPFTQLTLKSNAKTLYLYEVEAATDNAGNTTGEFEFQDVNNAHIGTLGLSGLTLKNGQLTAVEKAAPSGIASSDVIWADSTAHQWKVNDNNGGAQYVQIAGQVWAAPQATLSWDGFLGEMTTSARKAAIMPNAGHFTNLTCTATFTGTCTTSPKFNVVDITGSTSGTQTGSVTNAVATLVSAAQTLTFNAGDTVGISVSSAGATCTVPQFSCVATYTQP